jgi:hypothetical protein
MHLLLLTFNILYTYYTLYLHYTLLHTIIIVRLIVSVCLYYIRGYYRTRQTAWYGARSISNMLTTRSIYITISLIPVLYFHILYL